MEMTDLLRYDDEHVWHPFTPLLGGTKPVLISSGKGIYLNTADGRKIIDAVSSWWVNLHGHAHPAIAKAIAEQASRLEHVIFAGFTHEPAITLAKNLLTILPQNQSRVFFSDNGSTAVEVALKMAFQFWHNQGINRKKVITFRGAYHGDTFGSMSVGDRSIFTAAFTPFLFEVEAIAFPELNNEDEVLTSFTALANTGEIAAFIYEPLVQAAAGMRMYSPALLDKLIAIAQEKGVICIADEVFTGFGRTGKFFASDYMTNRPDIVAVSKGITGGNLPLGVTSCSQKIVSAYTSDDLLKTFFHGHSYTANPLACAAANASFEILTSAECQDNIQRIAAQHALFKQRMVDKKNVSNVRQCGTIIAIELENENATSYSNPLRKRIYAYFLERNILLRPLGNVLYILPPYVITDEELETIYQAIEDFTDSL